MLKLKDCLKLYWGRCLPFSFKKIPKITTSEVYNTSESFNVFIFLLFWRKKEPHAVESFICRYNHCSTEISVLKGLHLFFCTRIQEFLQWKLTIISQRQQFLTWQVNHFKVHNGWRGTFQEDGNQQLTFISIEVNLHPKLTNRAENLPQTQRNNTAENKHQEETS